MTEQVRLIVGLQPVREAIRVHGSALASVWVERAAGARAATTLDKLARFAEGRGARVERTSRAALDRLAGGARHQGAVAHAPELTLWPLEALVVADTSALLLLDGITDPQNFGACIRSAVALGCGSVVWGEHHAAPLSPATFRASAGAVEHARLCRVASLREAAATLTERGARVIALDGTADAALHELELSGPVALVVGAEDEGVGRALRRACIRAKLPMSGRIDSLNASAAAAVALYEVRRQRLREK